MTMIIVVMTLKMTCERVNVDGGGSTNVQRYIYVIVTSAFTRGGRRGEIILCYLPQGSIDKGLSREVSGETITK